MTVVGLTELCPVTGGRVRQKGEAVLLLQCKHQTGLSHLLGILRSIYSKRISQQGERKDKTIVRPDFKGQARKGRGEKYGPT